MNPNCLLSVCVCIHRHLNSRECRDSWLSAQGLRISDGWVLSPTQDIDVTPFNAQGTWRKRSWKDSKNWKIRRAAKCHLLSRHSLYNYDHSVALAAVPARSTPVGPISCQSLMRGRFMDPIPAWWATGNWWILGGGQSWASVVYSQVNPSGSQTVPNPYS